MKGTCQSPAGAAHVIADSKAGTSPGGRKDTRGRLRRLGEWCARHFVIVIVAWLVALATLQVLDRSFGGDYSDNYSLPGVQSQQGLDILKKHDPAAGGYGSQIVLRDSAKPLTAVSTQMSQTVADLQKLPHVLSVQNPLPPPGSQPTSKQTVGPLSGDAKTGYLTVRFDVQPSTLGDDYLDGVDTSVKPLRTAGVQVEYGGPLGELARPAADDRISELIGFAVAIVVLLVGFGSVLAVGIPLLSALISVVGGLACLGLLAAAFTLTLLGAHAWWTPRWLDRMLPHLDPGGRRRPRTAGVPVNMPCSGWNRAMPGPSRGPGHHPHLHTRQIPSGSALLSADFGVGPAVSR